MITGWPHHTKPLSLEEVFEAIACIHPERVFLVFREEKQDEWVHFLGERVIFLDDYKYIRYTKMCGYSFDEARPHSPTWNQWFNGYSRLIPSNIPIHPLEDTHNDRGR